MFPQYAVSTEYGKILLADSEEAISEDGMLFYRTGYALDRGGLQIGNFNDYLIGESGGSHTDRQYRLQEALTHALKTVAIYAE